MVILDCPPGAALVAENAVFSADAVVVPLVPSPLSMRSLEQVEEIVAASESKARVVAFLSMVDRRKTLHRHAVEQLPEKHSDGHRCGRPGHGPDRADGHGESAHRNLRARRGGGARVRRALVAGAGDSETQGTQAQAVTRRLGQTRFEENMDRSLNIVVGVTGGIAAYKAVQVVRDLVLAGHTVRVIATDAALRFVGAPTWEAISRQPLNTSIFDDVAAVRHVALGQQADVVVIAPATANTIAKLAAGMADDLLGTTVLASRAPLVVAPAMHTEMWQHPATVANVETLRARGVTIVGPDSGRLTGPDVGPGRMSEPDAIVAAVLAARASVDAGAEDGRHRTRPRRPPRARHRGRHARADRPGALPRQPLERQAGRRLRARRRGRGAPT